MGLDDKKFIEKYKTTVKIRKEGGSLQDDAT
jgi:hypothetical protein